MNIIKTGDSRAVEHDGIMFEFSLGRFGNKLSIEISDRRKRTYDRHLVPFDVAHEIIKAMTAALPQPDAPPDATTTGGSSGVVEDDYRGEGVT